jgi:hypothetical protein
LRTRDLHHYIEWVTISEPNAFRERGEVLPVVPPDRLQAHVAERAANGEEIHVHTFTVASFRALLEHCATMSIPAATVVEVVDTGYEAIGILRRASGC